jgi:outer membrane protein OmpA-like peptidoglycan-associated protein
MIRVLLLVAVAATNVGAAQAASVRFTACPVYRDTDSGRKSGCWLAEDPATGTRYDITAAPTKPDWNFAVLVEGAPAAVQSDPCGGVILDPARVSVLSDTPCTRFMLPAEGYTGRTFALPARNVRPLYEARQAPAKPFAEKRFTVPFDFGSSFVAYQLADYYVDAAINYALDTRPARVVIAGHAQTGPATVSGVRLAEPGALAAERADVIRRAFVMRGVDPKRISFAETPVAAPYDPAPFDGLTTAQDRRVDIAIIPETGPQ